MDGVNVMVTTWDWVQEGVSADKKSAGVFNNQ